MVDLDVLWDLDDDPEGNIQHIAEHDLTKEEVEEVLRDPLNRTGRSRRSGRPITFGWTSSGRHIAVVWEMVLDNPRTIYPCTAYDAPTPSK